MVQYITRRELERYLKAMAILDIAMIFSVFKSMPTGSQAGNGE